VFYGVSFFQATKSKRTGGEAAAVAAAKEEELTLRGH
jgi:hypothetical protein